MTLNGFRVPALTTRRAETEVELRDGQSFAIAGLMNNTSQKTREEIPLLGDLPIIGSLFKSKSVQPAADGAHGARHAAPGPRSIPTRCPSLPTDSNQFLPPDTVIGGDLQGGGGTVDGPPPAPPSRP